MVKVLLAAATGARFVGVGWTICPPPPQAARVKEDKLVKVGRFKR